ncbi:ATP-binding cassette domain-containing protein [Streptomyces turgidiscabies]|uniref:ABC-2 type transport system ATP-binding protein n=1 Tax=Streptomyces turgidiscabies TaxID=85558 RepID=A0ABU0RV79_9ACTN|nr:ABC transporter ATP-binding protein [Streptomyces turgidiscabies]MDQ0935703.1 ABC-2 type transport system ATP-binding protein [Streptomyces turgidiscabies]
MPDPLPALLVEDVHKSYARRRVLEGVDIELPRSCLGGVVGENGSGKSTLLRILAGQLAADHGRVSCPGGVGYCPQEPVLNPTLTTDQHLRLFQVAYALPHLDRANELLDQLHFSADRGQRVETLSGGTQQKLNLTLALMHDPTLLLLDEPYQGFDWETYQKFWELTGSLRDRGDSILMVSHISYEISRFDHLWRLHSGRLSERKRDDPPLHLGIAGT